VFELARPLFRIHSAPGAAPRGAHRGTEQLGERQFVIRRKAQTPLLQFAYKRLPPRTCGARQSICLLSILVDGDFIAPAPDVG